MEVSMQEVPEATEAHPWLMDFASLTKGQIIGTAELERITGLPATHTSFPFALMSLREAIMVHRERLGTPISIRIHHLTLVVNTDAEASSYHNKLFKEGERGMFRNMHRMKVTVDTAALTEEERKDHDRRLLVMGHKAMALRNVKANIAKD